MLGALEEFVEYLGIKQDFETFLYEKGMENSREALITFLQERNLLEAYERWVVERDSINLVERYINLEDWEVRENSNMTYSLQGLNFYITSYVSRTYWLEKVYPKKIRDAHLRGDFHIHDLQVLSVYCVGWDLWDLLLNGFRGVPGKIESRPPRHFTSALGQIVNFLYTLQGESAGAQAFSNFDTLLAPFIRYDRLSYEQVKQAIQEFVYNLNVPTRTGFQAPFTNLTFDLKVSPIYREQAALVGGELKDAVYGEFQEEVDMLNRAFFEVMLEGDAKGRVFTFPIPTYSITKDFDWENPVYEGLWKMSAKYGIPYFANFVNSEMRPEDVRSMCCRLRLDLSKLERKGGSFFGANPLTGSIGVVTVNMPRIGYLSKSEEEFFQRLSELMELAMESLEIKREVLEELTDRGLYPYSKFYLREIKSRFGQYWKNHFSTIGLVGMN
ncbi:MAG: ribonucleoside triphosphate reductase, partial [Aquificota bacterium]